MKLRRLAVPVLAALASSLAAPSARAEERTWNFLPTGNGHGFSVYDADKRKITQFLEHPYRYLRPRPDPKSDGFGRRNLAYDVYFGAKAGGGSGWLSEVAGDSPEYVDQSNIIRAPANAFGVNTESFFFEPFGLEKNVLVGVLHAPGAGAGYALLNFHMGTAGGDGTSPDANGEQVSYLAAQKAIVETGPGGGALVYVPIGGLDGASCDGAYDKGKSGADLGDPSGCNKNGNDVAVALQKNLSGDGWMGFAVGYTDNAGDAATLASDIATWIANRTPDKVLDDAKKEFEAWRKPPQAALCSEDEKKVWRQGEAVLRMGQVREPNIAGRKNNGMVLASLPPGEWHSGWVRDAVYALVALARSGHHEEARMGLEFFLNAEPVGKFKSYVRNVDYRISTVRYFGTGEEEADYSGQPTPNIEIDGWGLVLWAARQYVEASGDVAWLDKPTRAGTVWEAITQGIAGPLEVNLDAQGDLLVAAADSSIWEVHDANKRHFAYTTLTSARGFCDVAALANKGKKGDVAKYQDLARRLREGFLGSFVDAQGGLASSLEELSQGKYTDGAVAEAFTWNILQDWKGNTAKQTLDLLERLKVASGGYKRNDDGLSSYDDNEWILVDLRIANAYRRYGDGAKADGIVAHVVQKAIPNFYLLPELYDSLSATPGAYLGSIPMVGYGGGAYIMTMLDRSGIIEANDCGDGKGQTLPKLDCSGVSTNPGGTDGPGGPGDQAGGDNGVPDASEIPFVPACLCRSGPTGNLPPAGVAALLAAPLALLARRRRSRGR